jgi:hypothetical protein
VSTIVFSPLQINAASRAGQTVHLDEVRYRIRGLYTHPLTRERVPLPPHAWVFSSPGAGAIGSTPPSDSNGVTVTRKSDLSVPTNFGDAFANLVLFPLPTVPPPATVAAIRAAMVATGLDKYGYGNTPEEDAGRDHEVWLDWERNEWVSAAQVRRDLETRKRKLIRFPVWTSHDKSSIGGFRTDDDAKTEEKLKLFYDGGLLNLQLVEHLGTDGAPWDIVVDLDWVGAFVQLRYYNEIQKQQKQIPAGIALRTCYESGRECGGGCGVVDDRLMYVLHAATRFQLDRLDYHFETDAGTFVELRGGPPPNGDGAAPRLYVAEAGAPRDVLTRENRYGLPPIWHSKGMECVHGPGFGQRARWPDPRREPTSRTAPLVFDLDDTVLVDRAGKRIAVKRDQKLTVLDRVLRVRVLDVPGRSFLGDNYLRPESYVFDDGRDHDPKTRDQRDRQTLLYYYERRFYDLRERRLSGKGGVDDCVGARAAMLNDPDCHVVEPVMGDDPIEDGKEHERYRAVHIITDACVGLYYDGRSGQVRLSHVLFHAPCAIWTHDSKAQTVTPADVLQVLDYLKEAEWRWSQGHPALPESPLALPGAPPADNTEKAYRSPKEYNIVAADNVVYPNSPVFKTRYFFPVADDARKASSDTNADKGALTLHLYPTIADTPDKAQLTDGNQVRLAAQSLRYGATTGADDQDGALFGNMMQLVVAHELGHAVIGLTDEYDYKLDASTQYGDQLVANPTPPMMPQPSTGNVFRTDAFAEMNHNVFPRLRYQWHPAKLVSSARGAIREVTGGGRFVPEHTGLRTSRGRMRYLPAQDPWTPMRTVRHPTGRAELRLHEIGEDEGTLWVMFGGNVAADPFDHVLVVSSKLWFDFNPVPTSRAGHNAAMGTARRLHDFFYAEGNLGGLAKPTLQAGQRFQVRALGEYKRTAIVFELQIGYGPLREDPTKPSWGGQKKSRQDSDVAFLVSPTGPNDLLNPKLDPITAKGDQVRVRDGDVQLGVVRFILGLPHVGPAGVDNGPLAPPELAALAGLVGIPGGVVSTY